MTSAPTNATSRLPFCSPLPDDHKGRHLVRRLRIAIYILIAAALVAPVLQYHFSLAGRLEENPAAHKGAIERWRRAVEPFWSGEDIYATEGPHRLHPNMPFVVILLTPLAKLPMLTMSLAINLAKVAAIIACLLMVARLAAHHGQRICDWVLALGFAWAYLSILADIQHGNTNIFVLFLIVLHLWLYRRGWDIPAGAALALAICLKMTPALFVLYWLYQRNWRLVLATAVGGLICVGAIPLFALGADRFAVLTGSWMQNLILANTVDGAWYPIHINQSLSGVVSRLFLDGAGGDAFYNPDDYAVYGTQPMSGHVTLVALSPATVKWLLRLGQIVIVGAIGWGIGWRKLDRTDGRRLLHYGLIALGMMLLNQRTWNHHAAVLLLATVGIWQAIAFGLLQRTKRACCLWLMIGAGLITWLTASDLFKAYAKLIGDDDAFGKFTLGTKGLTLGELWSDLADAYGPQFWTFVILLITSVILARALRQGPNPYALSRQKLYPPSSP